MCCACKLGYTYKKSIPKLVSSTTRCGFVIFESKDSPKVYHFHSITHPISIFMKSEFTYWLYPWMILNIQCVSGKKKVTCTCTLIQIRMFSSETIPQNANDAGDLAWWGNESKRVHALLSTEAIEPKRYSLEANWNISIPPPLPFRARWREEEKKVSKWKIASFRDIDIF